MIAPTRQQLRTWFAACSIAATLLALPSHGAGQPVTCDADRMPALPLPELRISQPTAELRTAPESDGRVVITLPQDVEVPLLGRHDGWFVVNYRDGNRYRRLFMSAQAAESPLSADHGPRNFAAQRWSDAHSRICAKVSRARTAAKSFVGGALLAGASGLLLRALFEDDDDYYYEDNGHAWHFETENRYGKILAVWTGVSVAGIAGAAYQAIRLRQSRKELADLGSPPLHNGGGLPLPRLGGARGDLRFDSATGRQALVVTWQP